MIACQPRASSMWYRQVAKLEWAPRFLAPYLAACDALIPKLKEMDPTSAREDGLALVHVLARLGEVRVLHVIPKKSGEWTRTCPNGAIAAHYAATSGRPDGLNYELKQSPKNSSQALDAAGWTPLHYLAQVGGPDRIFEEFRMFGTDPSIKSKKDRDGFPKGTRALDVAEKFGHAEVIAFIKSRV